jgi:hypothetical protein
MTEYEIYLLIITAVALLINEVDSEKLVNKVKEMGLFSALSPVKEYILNSKKLINSVVKNVLGVSYGLTDILGFTALLVPTMNLLTNIINDYGLTSNNLGDMLKGLVLSGLVLSASVYGIKSVIKRIKNKIT